MNTSTIELTNPKDIYKAILNEIDILIQAITEQKETSAEIQQAQNETKENLTHSRCDIASSLEQLEKNSEWDVFTIAFYGETNAGKSTLIETLRILLQEPEKMREQAEFNRAIKDYNKKDCEILEYESKVDTIKTEYTEKFAAIESQTGELPATIQQLSGEIAFLDNECACLSKAAMAERKTSIAAFFRYLFGKLLSQKSMKENRKVKLKKESELRQAAKKIDGLTQLKKTLEQEIDQRIRKFEGSIAVLKEQKQTIEERLNENMDGRIIGDGRSDFTRSVTSYSFTVKSQQFALLDLPGIEGNEKFVMETINAAVQKAHAVFYVTGKPAPPQTGDEGNGTLEKIKNHLGEQTEVFTLFNKRIKNPASLKEPLTDDDEEESLVILDKIMSASLGDQYNRCICLSAYPAFLSAANCWKNDFETKQRKFIEWFSTPETLLKKTRLNDFIQMLTTQIVNNCKAKIKKSNYKKAAGALDSAAKEIKQICVIFDDLHKQLIKTKKSTDKQLDDSAAMLKARFDAEGHGAIENFKNRLRRNIYKDIDAEINNNEFKEKLKERTEQNIKLLQPELEKKFNGAIASFKDDVSDIIRKYLKYADELLSAYTGAGKFNTRLEFKIDIKSGINWVGTLTSVLCGVVGVIICLTNPAGWVVLLVSLAGLLFSLGKAIAGFFNHNYRKSQQKKSADENIEKTGEEIYKSIKENLDDANKAMDSGIQSIKEELTKSVDHVKRITKQLSQAESRFEELSINIITEGGR
jgi:GTPase Era involved in 16S rRNA processing